MGDTCDFCALLEIAAFLSRVCFTNSIIERVRVRARLKTFSEVAPCLKLRCKYLQKFLWEVCMRKSFDDLTIADDFMFCKIMQDESICKQFLEMILANEIGKIVYLSLQNSVTTGIEAKSVRLDLLVKDEAGKSYDIEMQVSNEYNLPKRMRYYQAAIDIAFLDKGEHYKALNDSYIIFVCLFDAIGKDRPLYTFENICLEDRHTPLRDGTKRL